MTTVHIKIKRLHPDAKLPVYKTDGSGAMDVFALALEKYGERGLEKYATYSTGLAFELPPGHGLFALSRSGHGFTSGQRLTNGIALLDCDYRGELFVQLVWHGNGVEMPNEGERICQILCLPMPRIVLEEVAELSTTERGGGGMGSTGNE